eukprot:766973-Hanusia_phi.AAC.10
MVRRRGEVTATEQERMRTTVSEAGTLSDYGPGVSRASKVRLRSGLSAVFASSANDLMGASKVQSKRKSDSVATGRGTLLFYRHMLTSAWNLLPRTPRPVSSHSFPDSRIRDDVEVLTSIIVLTRCDVSENEDGDDD